MEDLDQLKAENDRIRAELATAVQNARRLIATAYRVQEWSEDIYWQPRSAEVLNELKTTVQEVDAALGEVKVSDVL